MFFKRNRNRQADSPLAPTPRATPAPAAPVALAEPPAESFVPTPPSERDQQRRRRSRRGGTGGQGGERSEGRHPANNVPPAIAPHSEAFRALGVDEAGLDAIAALGFDQPTPIQLEAMPILLEGEDLIGLAQTGTGKTLAFGLPVSRGIDATNPATQAIILVPTRELAVQVQGVMEHLAKFYGFSVVGLVGGRSLSGDFSRLERSAHVVVGTPGRVIDHLDRGTLSLAGLRFAILDEADQMLDIGFMPHIDRILRAAPKDRQTALFSATMPMAIARLTSRYMRYARQVAIAPEHQTQDNVVQRYCEVAEREKFHAIMYLNDTSDLGRSLIFRRTKRGVDQLTERLQGAGIPARAIHGDLSQGERDRVMQSFRGGQLQVLVATNVAARGLDIPDIQHVINYDVPQNPEEYIHRIGRTARAGKSGWAVTFVGEWELDEWDKIVQTVGSDVLEHIKIPARQRALA